MSHIPNIETLTDVDLETIPQVDDDILVYNSTSGLWEPKQAQTLIDFDHSLIVVDEKSAGTNGGTFTNGAWRTRDLNTIRNNAISGASVSSNQITLPAGKYVVKWTAPAHRVNEHKTRFRNITDGVTEFVGSSMYSRSTVDSSAHDESTGFGYIDIAGTKVFEVQHRCASSRSDVGFGRDAGFSTVEVYTQVMIEQVG